MKGVLKYSAEFKAAESRWFGMELEIDATNDNILAKFKEVVDYVHAAAAKSGAPVLENTVFEKDDSGPTGDLENDILSCNDLPNIDAYRLLVNTKQYEHLKPMWQKRRAEIVGKESQGLIDAANALCGNNIIQELNKLTPELEKVRKSRNFKK